MIDVAPERLIAAVDRLQSAVIRAAGQTVKTVTDGVKSDLRAQVERAGLGRKLALTWRSKTFDLGALQPRGFIWSKAAEIIRAHHGAVITAGKGKFLAIPTAALPARAGGKRMTPDLAYARLGIRLRLVYRLGRPSLLVADMRATKSAAALAEAGKRGGYRAPSARALKTGTGMVTVPMFVLLPMVRLRKRLDYKAVVVEWKDRMPQVFNTNLQASIARGVR